ncbi:hypothetical protein AVEN_212181-1 [Araneus ventricosus]|uniref:Uncharacterized protein n=1 Tax=Araneus ventricosus TaxID=182803 RepID=A0A4Y2L801_ARAVE|nr:hypothetical protein AVEN_212181-1 [Araneus ventricosus]
MWASFLRKYFRKVTFSSKSVGDKLGGAARSLWPTEDCTLLCCHESLTHGLGNESRLHSIESTATKNPIAQQTQEILLKSTNIKLEWIRDHIGYSGNEAADVLAEKTTQEEIPTCNANAKKPYQESASKRVYHPLAKRMGQWRNRQECSQRFAKVKRIPTPWKRPAIMLLNGHGKFQTYNKRFKIINRDSCGCGNLGNLLHYATSCLFTTSYHITKPSVDLEPLR